MTTQRKCINCGKPIVGDQFVIAFGFNLCTPCDTQGRELEQMIDEKRLYVEIVDKHGVVQERVLGGSRQK